MTKETIINAIRELTKSLQDNQNDRDKLWKISREGEKDIEIIKKNIEKIDIIVEKNKNEITEIKNKNHFIEKDMTTLTEQISSIKTDTISIKKDVTELINSNKIKENTKKNVMTIGQMFYTILIIISTVIGILIGLRGLK